MPKILVRTKLSPLFAAFGCMLFCASQASFAVRATASVQGASAAASVLPVTGSTRYPAPIANMLIRGKDVRVLDVFAGPSGLTGYVLIANGSDRRIYYVTPDGKSAMFGMVFDEELKNLTAAHLAKFTNQLAPTTSVKNAEQGTVPAAPDLSGPFELAMAAKGALVEGKGLDVYIVFDPACPFCHQVYKNTRSMTDRLRIHWIPVGELGQRSKALAQTFVTAPDKGAAMAAAVEGTLPAASSVTPDTAAMLASNATILSLAKVARVPLILFKDGTGAKSFLGAPKPVQYEELLRLAQSRSK